MNMRSFFEKILLTIGLITIWAISAAINPHAGFIVGGAAFLTSAFAIFRPIPELGLKSRVFAAFITILSIPISLAALGMSSEANRMAELERQDPAAYKAAMEEKEKSQAKARAELAEKEAAKAKSAAEAKAVDASTKVSEYKQTLQRELASIPNFDVSTYTTDVDSINIAIVLFGAWALQYEEGEALQLDAEARELRNKFRAAISKAQARAFPILRDAYGPAMSKQLWEADGSARTIGNGFRTVEFVSAAFARNANIKQIQEQMLENLRMLRFTRSQYRWFKQAIEYTYYDIESPKDTDIVKWERNGRYTILK